MKYLVVVERGEGTWGAHVPDIPGCIAAGETREEALRLIRRAIVFHIEGCTRPASRPLSLRARPRSSRSMRPEPVFASARA